ncbi:Helix-turn-helix domain-containing protein [Leifsonia sp. 98AMF]|jgi:DNA-binding transcriptional ArsR family regulator|uniref:ArsR/SmtB family transcription factor n=1 Tax=Microbacteriaceae TaxID=85023 RepID=UPI0003827DA9|nr:MULTISPECIES: metalloregulator ArsR/SmtB family transcription factor [Microbacteriaceae]SDH06024.1 Helix-turn-helix domain-containing protein [Leifsonia sp. 197AMF]SDJ34382.1 Helix-turn-helix domain-containing protein [Leifsonia sp. 466MF]SDK45488.1 Helix-turn-helix domain-containing protein [Leifsonia sp. 157MF]SDN55172.1 Helix-turn-helix domain-containing protein [Leifsonia sp. 509MF]SEN54713.1 Helix-turn-helix domain-containing protein [Leifsonia sp. 467MF]
MADIFDVIADPTRRDILRVLLDRNTDAAHSVGEISVSEIVATLELSQPTVSKHLKVLREAGLVSVREEGQHRYYSLDAGPLVAVEDWIIPFTASDEDMELSVRLAEETREFASTVGKVLADTRHRVSSATERVTPKKWRKD